MNSVVSRLKMRTARMPSSKAKGAVTKALDASLKRGPYRNPGETRHQTMRKDAVEAVEAELKKRDFVGATVTVIDNEYVMNTARGDEHDEKEYLYEVEFPSSTKFDSYYFIIGFKWFKNGGVEFMVAGYAVSEGKPRLGQIRHVF